MTRATAALNALGDAGLRGTFTHILLRAAALARNPRLRRASSTRKLTPGPTSVSRWRARRRTRPSSSCPPSIERQLRALVGQVEGVAAARLKEAVDLANMRRVGWMTPFGFFRRFVIRWLQSTFWFRRRLVGTFQVSSVPTVDAAVPLQFYSGSILSFGRVRNSVVAVDGRIETRPTLSLTICVEHVAMDSMRAAALLNAIGTILESDELVDEARDAAHDVRHVGASRETRDQATALPPASGG